MSKVKITTWRRCLHGRQIIAPFWEIGVAESNSDVRIFVRRCEIAVCSHAQYNKLAQNSPERLARRQAASCCNVSQLPHFLMRGLHDLAFSVVNGLSYRLEMRFSFSKYYMTVLSSNYVTFSGKRNVVEILSTASNCSQYWLQLVFLNVN